MEQQIPKSYLEKANKVLNILMEDKFTRPIDCSIVLGLVASKIVESCEKLGVDKQDVIDAMCFSVKKFSE